MNPEGSGNFPVIVLAGGRSQRMGADKTLVTLGGEPMLARVVRQLRPIASSMIIVAAANQQLPPLPNSTTVLRDRIPEAGPLHGLIVGLEHVRVAMADQSHVLVTSTDLPFLTAIIAEQLVRHATSQSSAALVLRHAGILQPLPGVYRVGLLDDLEQAFVDGLRSLRTAAHDAEVVDSGEFRDLDPEARFLCNINTPEDLELARRLR